MALSKGTNSYVTVAEADAYFADSVHNVDWTAIDETLKAQLLVSATRLIDQIEFQGVAISSSQSLAFPREGEYLDRRLQLLKSMSPTPALVETATFELALHLSADTGVLKDEASFSRLTVGPITIERPVSASKTPKKVLDMLKPLSVNTGNVWWRAN